MCPYKLVGYSIILRRCINVVLTEIRYDYSEWWIGRDVTSGRTGNRSNRRQKCYHCSKQFRLSLKTRRKQSPLRWVCITWRRESNRHFIVTAIWRSLVSALSAMQLETALEDSRVVASCQWITWALFPPLVILLCTRTAIPLATAHFDVSSSNEEDTNIATFFRQGLGYYVIRQARPGIF